MDLSPYIDGSPSFDLFSVSCLPSSIPPFYFGIEAVTLQCLSNHRDLPNAQDELQAVVGTLPEPSASGCG
jgi:hypothetical protein